MWKKIMLWSSCCLGTLISFNAVASVELSPSPATMENVSANTVAVAKINAGMLELFALKFQSDDYRNTLMSPGSMQSALGMIYAGSAGKCAQQLEQKIGLDSKYFDYHKALQMGSHGADDTGGSVVNSVNMVAMSGVKKVNAEFERLIKECFSGVIVLFPAGGQEAMIGKINNFVAQKTNKMITNFLAPDSLNLNGEAIVLLNVLTFRGVWQNAFEAKDTVREKFTTPWGESSVNMMRRTGEYKYFANDLVSGVEIPYKDENLVMNVLLPTQAENDAGFTNLARITRELPKNLDTYLASAKMAKLDLRLPRFVMRGGGDYVEILKKFGITDIFEPGGDWSKICGNNFLIVSRIIQQAALVVDEHGSRGAAASAAGEPGEILEEFKVNRPFVVLIRDTKRNLILFAAAVVKL